MVDPVRTPTAAAADLHLQPFPGSDAALAFALVHVLARDGFLDERFLAAVGQMLPSAGVAVGLDRLLMLLLASTL